MVLNALICAYFLLGIYFSMIRTNSKIPRWYFALVVYISFKLTFNYRKCTISYLEVKLRGVKKEEGYLYALLENVVDLRYDPFLISVITIFNTYIFYSCYENLSYYL
jgi:hypothetical protein